VSAVAKEALAQVQRFRTVVLSRLGLRFDDDKLAPLADTLTRRADARGRSPDEYLADLESGTGSEELRDLSNELTVAETYFFRNVEQMMAFVEVAVPWCARARPARRPLRILSAGCASGDEAYSLAILAKERLEPAGHALSIHAFDVNPQVLERAGRARYSTWALRETPAELRARYFRADGRELVLGDDVRRVVTFEERNLLAEDATFWSEGAFDVVFCRNVLMYLGSDAARTVVDRISRSLVPGGFLFVGYAETLRGLSQDFHLRHTHSTFYYQRRESGGLGSVPADLPDGGSRVPVRDVALVAGRLDGDASWIETIRHASERIAALTSRSNMPEDLSAGSASTPRARAREIDISSEAVDLIRQERFEEALVRLSCLPLSSSRDPDILLLRAVLSTHGGDLDAAQSLCREVLLLEELHAGAHYLLALCREAAGDRTAAAEHDRIAAYLDPTFAMPRLHLGLLARRAGDQPAARSELREALALLEREDASRLLLYGGGFARSGLLALCSAQLRASGGTP